MSILRHMVTSGLVMAISAGLGFAQDDEAVRLLELKGLKRPFPKGTAEKPSVIASSKDLAKAFPEDSVREALAKKVDFDKEMLLFFAWSGSGQDKLTPAVVKDGNKATAVFTYQRGRTRDLRGHLRLFALPKDFAWRVDRAGQER